jgi:hypothetical protein
MLDTCSAGWAVVKCLLTDYPRGKPWFVVLTELHNYFQHGRFQSTKVMSLSTELGRDVCAHSALYTGMIQLQHTSDQHIREPCDFLTKPHRVPIYLLAL